MIGKDQPLLVSNYRTDMRGVDTFDAVTAPYNVWRKSYGYKFKIFQDLLNVIKQNSRICL